MKDGRQREMASGMRESGPAAARRRVRLAAAKALAGLALAGLGAAALAEAAPGYRGERWVREGVAIDFEARSTDGSAELLEGGSAEIRFRISDAASGQPLSGLTPGVWLDLAQAPAGPSGRPSVAGPGGETSSAGNEKACRDKIALYLKGVVGVRPLLDLNGYHLLLLNKDASLTVIDPLVSMAGKTSTLATVMLRRPAMDWAKSADGKRLFVSMPLAGQVAVVDSERFKVVKDIETGPRPVRVALQPDGRYLWVGLGAHGNAAAAAPADPAGGGTAGTSGVAVIDTRTLEVVARLPSGRGHHEIAFSEDSRHAFVSNRDAGTVSIFDVATLKPLRELRLGPRPISLAYSALSGALYVADGQSGRIDVVDGRSFALRRTLPGKPGLGPLRLTPDGRFAIALNTREHTASVVDTANNALIHTLAVSAEPYQIVFTRAYAYIRGLASEKVTMLNLATLGAGKAPVVQNFSAGAAAPRQAGDLPIADGMAPASTEAGVFVVNPVDNTAYFYMEGMNAPMAAYPNRGHTARGATVVGRGMKEVEPGLFSTRARLPVPGRYDVAFMLEQPRVLHCFSTEVKESPTLAAQDHRLRASFHFAPGAARANSTVPVRVRLVERRSGRPKDGVSDLRIRYFLAPASPLRVAPARFLGDGLYEAQIELREAGAYYLHLAAASLGSGFEPAPYAALRVREAAPATPRPADAAPLGVLPAEVAPAQAAAGFPPQPFEGSETATKGRP